MKQTAFFRFFLTEDGVLTVKTLIAENDSNVVIDSYVVVDHTYTAHTTAKLNKDRRQS